MVKFEIVEIGGTYGAITSTHADAMVICPARIDCIPSCYMFCSHVRAPFLRWYVWSHIKGQDPGFVIHPPTLNTPNLGLQMDTSSTKIGFLEGGIYSNIERIVKNVMNACS